MESIVSTNLGLRVALTFPFSLVLLNMPMVNFEGGGRRDAVTRTTAARASLAESAGRAAEARVRSSPEPEATDVRARLRAGRGL